MCISNSQKLVIAYSAVAEKNPMLRRWSRYHSLYPIVQVKKLTPEYHYSTTRRRGRELSMCR